MKKGLYIMMLVLAVSFVIALLWDKIPIISNSVHFILDPTFGKLLQLDRIWGFISIIFIITLAITLIQKYMSDQDALKELREEQKRMQEEMKQYKDDPKKMMEIQKKQLESIPKSFDLTTKPLIYTSIPIILFFRWFNDFFKTVGDDKIFGVNWIWAYLIVSIILSIILRKILKVY